MLSLKLVPLAFKSPVFLQQKEQQLRVQEGFRPIDMLRELMSNTASWGAVKGLPSLKTSVTIYQQTRRNMPEAVATL